MPKVIQINDIGPLRRGDASPIAFAIASSEQSASERRAHKADNRRDEQPSDSFETRQRTRISTRHRTSVIAHRSLQLTEIAGDPADRFGCPQISQMVVAASVAPKPFAFAPSHCEHNFQIVERVETAADRKSLEIRVSTLCFIVEIGNGRDAKLDKPVAHRSRVVANSMREHVGSL
jgi:hypothetical protein